MGVEKVPNDEPKQPEPGDLMPDFELPSAGGQLAHLSDYRGRKGAVLIFTGGAECAVCRHAILSGLCDAPEEYARQRGELLVILRCTPAEAELVRRRDRLACQVLVDEDGQVHRQVGAELPDGQPATAVFVTNRQGKVCLASRSSRGDTLPTRQALLDRLSQLAVESAAGETTEL